MIDPFTRIAENMIARVSGPMHFRLLLQPVMASIFAIISGLKDARSGKPAYFWALFTDPNERRSMMRDGWKSVRNVFILAIVLDIVYQLIVLHFIYPVEALLVAFILAIIPYILVRGPANRIFRFFVTPKPSTDSGTATKGAPAVKN